VNFLFAWRYFKAKKSTNAINIIAWVSVSAIIVGTASLIIVLSVFNGLEDLVKSLYSSFYPEIRVAARTGKFIELNSEQLKTLATFPGITHYSLVLEDKALLQNGTMQPVVIKGVDSNYRYVTGVAQKLGRGKFDLGTEEHPGVVLGVGVENALGLESDRSILPLTVYIFKKGASKEQTDPLESLSTGTMAATGAFVIQSDFDNKYAITNLAFMRTMLNIPAQQYSAIEIAVSDPQKSDLIKQSLQKYFGDQYAIQTRYEQNRSLYSVMTMEKWVIYGVLTLILVVAAFNMVGALTMLVLEKQKDIQVLKAMGAHNGYIQGIFLSEGILLALIGGIGGVLLAIFICWLQVKYKLVPMAGDSFVIDHYPVKLMPGDFILVFCTILVVALLASWFPSRKAALQPIELKT